MTPEEENRLSELVAMTPATTLDDLDRQVKQQLPNVDSEDIRDAIFEMIDTIGIGTDPRLVTAKLLEHSDDPISLNDLYYQQQN